MGKEIIYGKKRQLFELYLGKQENALYSSLEGRAFGSNRNSQFLGLTMRPSNSPAALEEARKLSEQRVMDIQHQAIFAKLECSSARMYVVQTCCTAGLS